MNSGDAFDASRHGQAAIYSPEHPRAWLYIREGRECMYCGAPVTTYYRPGDRQFGAYCKRSHQDKGRRKRIAETGVRIEQPVPRLEQRRREERRVLDPVWRAANCPRPDKLVWLTAEGAADQLRSARGNPSTVDPGSLNAYQCVCGGFHIGNRTGSAS